MMHRDAPHLPVGSSDDAPVTWELRLFVAGTGLEIQGVREALERVCEVHLPNHYRIAVVDVFLDPAQADAFNIVVTPTLIRQLPFPVRRVIGDLSLTSKVVIGLGMPVSAEVVE